MYSVCCEARISLVCQLFFDGPNGPAEIMAVTTCSECHRWLEITQIKRLTDSGWRRVKTSRHLTKEGQKLIRLQGRGERQPRRPESGELSA
jgi:hypothetical protein